jgi:hypothetical protein
MIEQEKCETVKRPLCEKQTRPDCRQVAHFNNSANFFRLPPGANFSYIFFHGKLLSAENSVEFVEKMIF